MTPTMTPTRGGTSALDGRTAFDNEAVQQFARLEISAEGGPAEAVTAAAFALEQADEARGYEKATGGSLYTWKSDGAANWLVAGRADRADGFCFVVLPEHRGDRLDLADDEGGGEGEDA